MGFWSGITDFINDAVESVNSAFSSVKENVNDIASYVSDAFEGVYHAHDKTDDNEYKITPIKEDKALQYDFWLRTHDFSLAPDYEDFFKSY